MASIGLPGLGDFIGEFLTLLGTYRISLGVTVAAVIGILISTLYALKVIQRAFHGPNNHEWSLPDLGKRELVMMVPMMLVLLWIGLYPQPLFRTFEPAMRKLQQYAAPQPVLTMAPDTRQLSYGQNGLPGINRR
jgi:NADH-quinone oxidoreductase subunit M